MVENEKNDAGFEMAGTEQTWEYVVVAVTPRGRVGYRVLEGGSTRVRVEPADSTEAEIMADSFPTSSWKQYGQDNQPRFSIVVDNEEALAEVLSVGLEAVEAKVQDGVQVNPVAPDWAKALVASPVKKSDVAEELKAQASGLIDQMSDFLSQLRDYLNR